MGAGGGAGGSVYNQKSSQICRGENRGEDCFKVKACQTVKKPLTVPPPVVNSFGNNKMVLTKVFAVILECSNQYVYTTLEKFDLFY